MSAEEFNELAGRIEGLSIAVMFLAAELEHEAVINGPRYCEVMRGMASKLSFDGGHLAATQRTLREMAKRMDEARSQRRSSVDRT
ncbi:hypothetical protein [Methylocaldum sp.]|uniref:hypothetical protein n=1 Tax=Methylocaldum sp. TaxID=1969727 RepID=UPI002D6678A8|nr:hypothetical protein [Methylocaldum sp.]HYE35492.1 hypothetical protein [Methylocaldum sp.]